MTKALLSLLFGGLMLASCSSAFKTGQTPDDVYYSYGGNLPARENQEEDENNADGYQSYFGSNDDNYLRMKVNDPKRWSTIDDVNYWYGYNNPNTMWNNSWVNYNAWNTSPWMMNSWGWGIGWNTWSNPWAFNSYYNSWSNPWCWNRPVVVVNKYPTGTSFSNMRPGMNFAGFSNSLFDRPSATGRSGSKYGSSSNSGDVFRSIFRGTGSGNSVGETISRPGRLFDSNSSGGSSRSSGGSSNSGGSSRSSGGGSSSGSSRGGRGG